MKKESQPMLSIIVPVFNTIKQLPTCLDTLLAQTLNSLEIIVVDDHSTDDIFTSIKNYLKDFRLSYIRLDKNRGPGGARNAGLARSIGKYVGFCDSDDWVDFNYYQEGIYLMEQYQADIGMYTFVRESDVPTREKLYKCRYDTFMELSPDIAFKTLTYQLNAGIKVIPPCTNKIYRKSFLDTIEANFEENMYFQDVLFTIHTFMKSNKIICIPNTEYHHYRRPNSIIQSFSSKHIKDFVKLFTLIKQYLQRENKYECYCLNYYKLCSHFYNIIIRQIFQFVADEKDKKTYIRESFAGLKQVVDFEEYFEYITAEELRRHIQPHINDTFLY
ncbi:MAG: glycosyltransferase [Candidatus Cloacimonetes bacterium]|nr:glycosyltransferase [Candidatus Cloacimonadota bacterium]